MGLERGKELKGGWDLDLGSSESEVTRVEKRASPVALEGELVRER